MGGDLVSLSYLDNNRATVHGKVYGGLRTDTR